MTNADLKPARELFDEGYILCKLYPDTKQPVGLDWNNKPVKKFDTNATGYGLPLAVNGRCSVDPDNVERANEAIAALFNDTLDRVMAKGVRTISTRPGSGGRSMFKDPGGLRRIVFTTKESGTILELRAAGANLQDTIPGLRYKDKEGNICTQKYANGKTYMDAPEMPKKFYQWWKRMSDDIDYRHEQQIAFANAVGETPTLSMAGEGEALAFRPKTPGLRNWFNQNHDVETMLLEQGYTESDGRYSPPTSTGAPGVREIPGKDGGLWQSDHASDPLHGTFNTWCVYVAWEHSGDVQAAEAAMVEEFKKADEAGMMDAFPDLDESEIEPPARTLDEIEEVPDVDVERAPVVTPPGKVGDLAVEIHSNLVRPQPSYAVSAALAVASVATNNRFVTGLMGTGLNLYTVQVGPTSAGKDGPRAEAKALLQQIGMHSAFPEGISSGAALIRTVADEKSVLYLPDEFGMLLQIALSDTGSAHQKDLVAEIMRFYTLATGTHGGKRYAKATDSIEPIKRPFVSLIGSTTPGELAKALHQGHVENGLLNRILYSEADQDLPRKSRDKRPGYSAHLVMWLRSLTGMPPMLEDDGVTRSQPLKLDNGEVPFTPAAEQLFDAFDLESDQRSASGDLGPLWNRAHENALRVAGIVALGMPQMQVDEEVARWAIDHVRHSVELMVGYVRANVAESKFDEQCKKALKFIKKAKTYAGDKQFGVACKKGLMPKGLLTKLLHLPARDVGQVVEYLEVSKLIGVEELKIGDSQKATTLYRAG